MNAAEITDKLGLHSLRQRAWVYTSFTIVKLQLIIPVHPIHLCYIRRWSLRRFGVACQLSPQGWSSVNLASSITPQPDCISPSFPTEQSKQTSILSTSPPHRSLVLSSPTIILVSSSGPTSIRGARVATVRCRLGRCSLTVTCACFQLRDTRRARFSPFLTCSRVFGLEAEPPFLHLALQSCVSAWYKSRR